MTSPEQQPVQEPQAQNDALSKASVGLDKVLNSDNYNRSAIERALTRFRKAGEKKFSSPGELYANMADKFGLAAQAAEKGGIEEDKAIFSQLQEDSKTVAETLAEPTEGVSKASKNPRRTTGKAAG